MNQQKLEELIIKHEGYQQYPYVDSTGDRIYLENGNITVGIGCNLSAGISMDLSKIIMRYYLNESINSLKSYCPVFNNLDEARQAVLIDMCFNMGINKLMKFTKTLGFIIEGKYEDASKEMLNSQWSQQVGKRAITLSEMILTGQWP